MFFVGRLFERSYFCRLVHSQPFRLLKIYPAIQLLHILNKGGSTYPWVVEVLDDTDTPAAFVVKMFTPKQVQQQHAVAVF